MSQQGFKLQGSNCQSGALRWIQQRDSRVARIAGNLCLHIHAKRAWRAI
jgi:hypothetical protein